MSWRLRIEHRTGFEYSDPVVASYNEARLSPLDRTGQFTIEHRIDIEPTARLYRYRDYWGTRVCAFDLHERHTRLVVTGTSTVETTSGPRHIPEVAWDDIHSDTARNRFCELLSPTPYVPEDSELLDTAREFGKINSPLRAVDAAMQWTRDHLQYATGATTVQTTAAEAFRVGRGVCQDFVHLGLALLRGMGVPARYASGYSYPRSAGDVAEPVSGQSHAWIEAWLGEWEAIDVTSGDAVGERHVLVARGRDYSDVPPLKGIYHGGTGQALGVSVTLTRLA
jgi:transglutaminase-like putative cysteine protease